MLSTEDRLAINDLYARYCVMTDLGDPEGWARCFTEDGAFITKSEMRGRAQLTEAGMRGLKARESNPHVNSQHWHGNLIVEGDSQRAEAFCYLIRVAKNRASGAFEIVTHSFYQDVLVKLNGQWLFESRRALSDPPPPSALPGAKK
jgi:hypothetical protein